MGTSTADIIASYAALLIIQYIGLAKASATVKALVTGPVMDQLPTQVSNGFTIGSAVGAQLDIIGKYVGVTRTGSGLQGQTITLDDADFTTFIKLAIAQNNAGSSLGDIQAFLHTYFNGILYVFDYANMEMDYYFNSSGGSLNLAELFVTQKLLPVPMGVQLGALIYGPNLNAFFGFRTYKLPAQNVSPFNSYQSYTTNTPWLSYQDAIIPPA